MIAFEEEVSRREVGRFKVALLAIGASEQHADHLPLGTDTFLARAVVDDLKKEEDRIEGDIMILPPLSYGKSTEHLGIPGTISLSARTLISFLEDVCSSLKESHFDTLLIVNGHGGNTGILDGISYDLKHAYGLDVYAFPLGKIFASYGPIGTLPKSMHAGAAETAIMRYRYVQFSSLYDRIPSKETSSSSLDMLSVLGVSSWGWSIGDLSREGYVGNPALGSIELGEALLHFTVETIIKEINAIMIRRKNAELF